MHPVSIFRTYIFILIATTVLTLGLSTVVLAQSGTGLVPCTDACKFDDILTLINNIVTFLITSVFIPVIILLFMYAGFKYLLAQGNPSKIINIKKMVWHIIVGMLLVLTAWLIVRTAIKILVSNEAGTVDFLGE